MSGRHPFRELTKEFTPERRRRVDAMKAELLSKSPLREFCQSRVPDGNKESDDTTWLSDYPIREMIKRGWIQAERDKESRLNALRNFLGGSVVEPRMYQEAVGFRITQAAQRTISLGSLSAWLRKGEIDAQRIETADYDEGLFKAALLQIRKMTDDQPEDFIPVVTKLCAQAGVAFCVVQELPKIGANGVARWLTDREALIQISTRGKYADIFWFTFFHEACHLMKHRTQRRIIIDGLEPDPDMAELEEEANQFARDFLIPPDAWNKFCAECKFTKIPVQKFAQSIGIAPFIVVGRLQKEKRIPYSRLTNLKWRYKWNTDSNN